MTASPKVSVHGVLKVIPLIALVLPMILRIVNENLGIVVSVAIASLVLVVNFLIIYALRVMGRGRDWWLLLALGAVAGYIVSFILVQPYSGVVAFVSYGLIAVLPWSVNGRTTWRTPIRWALFIAIAAAFGWGFGNGISGYQSAMNRLMPGSLPSELIRDGNANTPVPTQTPAPTPTMAASMQEIIEDDRSCNRPILETTVLLEDYLGDVSRSLPAGTPVLSIGVVETAQGQRWYQVQVTLEGEELQGYVTASLIGDCQ